MNKRKEFPLLVKAQIRLVVRRYELSSLSSEFFQELEKQLEELIVKACYRAKENKRRLVMAQDI